MEEISGLCLREGLPAAIPLIRKFAEHQPDAAATSLLRMLQSRSVQVQTLHGNGILGALKRAKHWRHVLLLFQQLPDLQLVPDEVSFNTLLSAFSSAGRWQAAIQLFSSMRRTADVEPNQISYNALIDACGKAMRWQLALQIFQAMDQVVPNAVTLGSVLSACDKGAQWVKAMALLQDLSSGQAQQIVFDVALYNSIFSILGKLSQWQECLAGLLFMPLLRLQPNQISYVAVISACSRSSQWAQACDLLKMMAERSTPPNVISCNAALNAMASRGSWQRCVVMMADLDVPWDSVSYCTTISACGNSGDWEVVIQLLQQMQRRGLDRTVVHASITACGKSDQWQVALHLLHQMPKWKISPDEVSYNAAISACDNGAWQHALLLAGLDGITAMSEIGLGALSAAMRFAPWEQTMQLLSWMLDLQIIPSGICVGNLLRPLQETLGKAAARQVLKDMQALSWAQDHKEHRGGVGPIADAIAGVSVLRASPGLVAVAKPGGVSTEELQKTLSAALKVPLELVSRLDQGTSGVLPLALPEAGDLLRAQFTAGLVEKEYWCLCSGEASAASGSICKPLLVQKSSFSSKYAQVSDAGREARTDFQVVEVYEDDRSFKLSFMRVKPLTGRTHQIRAHMASIGLPIVGDSIYGNGPELFPWCPRLFLHCRRLQLMDLSQELLLEAPLPKDLRAALSTLKRRSVPDGRSSLN